MTEKERQRLVQDLRYRIMCLAPDVQPSEVRLEVDHGILPIIQKLMDKVVARKQEEFMYDNGLRENWESPRCLDEQA